MKHYSVKLALLKVMILADKKEFRGKRLAKRKENARIKAEKATKIDK